MGGFKWKTRVWPDREKTKRCTRSIYHVSDTREYEVKWWWAGVNVQRWWDER